MSFLNFFKDKSEKKYEPRVLIESNSPLCNLQALVEDDDRCAYFYLYNPGSENPILSTCWIRNYVKAPEKKDIKSMREGKAPLLEAKFCDHPNGARRLEPSKLHIVWFEEGDGVALLYDNELLSVIPGWANHQCPGYSRDCNEISDLAWPLGKPNDNVLFKRVSKAKEFWDSWNEELWGSVQQSYLDVLRTEIGDYSKYYAIDGGNWPPKAMVRVEKGNLTYIITIGVSIVPQPAVEQYYEEPSSYRRFEFAFVIETELLKRNESGILSYISGQTGLPWVHRTWLGHGHTIPCDQIWPEEKAFSSVLLLNSKFRNDLPGINFPKYRGDDINLVWIVPITEDERLFAQSNSSDKLIERFSGNEPVWVFDGKKKFIKF